MIPSLGLHLAPCCRWELATVVAVAGSSTASFAVVGSAAELGRRDFSRIFADCDDLGHSIADILTGVAVVAHSAGASGWGWRLRRTCWQWHGCWATLRPANK